MTVKEDTAHLRQPIIPYRRQTEVYCRILYNDMPLVDCWSPSDLDVIAFSTVRALSVGKGPFVAGPFQLTWHQPGASVRVCLYDLAKFRHSTDWYWRTLPPNQEAF